MDLDSIIYNEIRKISDEADTTPSQPLDRETPVFDSGLDSLGFAILVAKLEESLGFDPFVLMTEAVYPVTLGQFIDVYAAHIAKQ